jgi:D-3-phosphoglycerate dehydrogenase / 2-oxoglutarate reductase
VNAPLLAEERGLRVSSVTSSSSQDYVSLVRLRAGDVAVAGTLVGPRNRQRLVEVWGFDVDMEPTAHMVFLRYVDRPGIVGVIGQKLGEAGVNIATMQVGRREAGGEALIAMAVDSELSPDTLEEIRSAIESTDVRTLDLA